MLLLLIILIIQYVSSETGLLSNKTIEETRILNEMEYSHESKVTGEEAEFSFIIHNTNYSRNKLGIDSYYFSITFIDEKPHDERTEIEEIPTNQTEYHGRLKMENLDEEGNYFICVFFLKNNQTDLIGSSRFCDVVSVSDNCKLEASEGTFSNQHVFILLAFVAFILAATVLFTCIRDYIYRPRTIQAILDTLPQHHAQNLEVLAPTAGERRRRTTEPALKSRLRESVASIHYDPEADQEFHNYHGHDNIALDTVTE